VAAGTCDLCGTPSASNLCGNCRARLTARLAGQTVADGPAARTVASAPAAVVSPKDAKPRAILPQRRIAENLLGAPETVSEQGSLVVDGKVGAGWKLFASEDLTVSGVVERARLEAGIGSLTLEAPCREGEFFAGLLREPLKVLADTVGDADEVLERIARETLERVAAAVVRGETLTTSEAFRAIAAEKAPDLAARLDRAAEALNGMGETGGEALVELLTAVYALRSAVGSATDMDTIAARSGDLSAALETSRAIEGRPPPSVMESLQSCKVTCAGGLELRGQGARDCTISVGGDLTLVGRNASITGGETRVGGDVTAEKLGGGNQRTPIVLEGAGRGVRVTCAVVMPGVVVQHGDHSIEFAKEERNVTVSLERGRLEMASRKR
jgi:hypothetical protein